MEHKGGRIKDHIRREEPQGQDDWIDVEWLDDDEDLDSRPDAASGEQGGAQDKSEEEPFEIEDWRDEENWNLEKKEETPKSEPAKDPSAKRKNTGARSTDGQNPQRKRRPQQQGSGTGKDGKNGKKPVKKAPQKDSRKDGRREQEQRDQDRQKKKKSGSAARPVKAAGRGAGKAGETPGKAVGKGISIALKCGCFVVMAVIVLELWQEFWVERSTLGEIWRVAADRNYAQALYLGIAGVILLYGVISALWLLGGKKMPDGNRVRSYDTGRGLTAFILFAILAAAAGYVVPVIPASPQVLEGARLALAVVERVSTVILGCSVIGVVLCVIRKIVGR